MKAPRFFVYDLDVSPLFATAEDLDRAVRHRLECFSPETEILCVQVILPVFIGTESIVGYRVAITFK